MKLIIKLIMIIIVSMVLATPLYQTTNPWELIALKDFL